MAVAGTGMYRGSGTGFGMYGQHGIKSSSDDRESFGNEFMKHSEKSSDLTGGDESLLRTKGERNHGIKPGSVQGIFERASWNSRFNDENVSLLFADRESIPDTVLSGKSEYTDPLSGQKVPVSVEYRISYSEDGISCRKDIKDGGRESGRELWSLQFENPEDYSKVREFLNGFGAEDRLTFASQKSFWEDFIGGEINVDGFRDYYDKTENGVIDFEGRMAKGEALKDIVSEPYAGYFNNQGFIGHVYTEQEMWDA